MTNTLTIEILKDAVAGHAAAFRCVTEYQPAGGAGDKVFPPTYEGGKYAVETRIRDGRAVQCVLLDSVQSQANRMELALLEALRAGRIELPLISVRFDQEGLHKKFAVTSLEAPHRAADAIFRDSLLDGTIFRSSNKGRILDHADARNATGLFGLCPTALVFGIWDSTGPRGGLGTKFQRALVSEMVGWDAEEGVNSRSRIDSLGIVKGAGPVFRTEENGWTINADSAARIGGKPALYGLRKGKLVPYDENKDQDEGKPSKINHGNVAPSLIDDKTKQRLPGGFTISRATQTTVLSLAALRRLRFPLNGAADSDLAMNKAARTALAALGLVSAVLAREEGADLRSRCLLVPTELFVWEILDTPGGPSERYTLDGDQAVKLFNDAVAQATAGGLPWDGEIRLTPHADLVTLLRRSQELAMHQAEQEGG